MSEKLLKLARDAGEHQLPFTKGFRKLLNSSSPSRLYTGAQFYPSAMPVCSVLALASRLGEKASRDFSSEFFKSVGSAVHNAVQKMLPDTLDEDWAVWADWTGQCGRWGPERSMGPVQCPKCGTPARHKEIKVSAKGLSGKLDLVLANKNTKTLHIVDIKTATDRHLKDLSLANYKARNVSQLMVYAWLFSETDGAMLAKDGWKLESVSLAFVSRNHPNHFREVSWPGDEAVKAGKEMVEESRQAWNAALASFQSGDPSQAVNARMCQSADHYRKFVEPTMYRGCPLARKCVLGPRGTPEEWLLSLQDKSES